MHLKGEGEKGGGGGWLQAFNYKMKGTTLICRTTFDINPLLIRYSASRLQAGRNDFDRQACSCPAQSILHGDWPVCMAISAPDGPPGFLPDCHDYRGYLIL